MRPIFGDDVNSTPDGSSDVEASDLELRLAEVDRMASIGTLAAGVAHEINNPLSYVLANLRQIDNLLASLRVLESEEARLEDLKNLLTEARDGAERMQHVVRDLTSFARTPDEKREPLMLSDLLDSASNLARNEIKHRATLEKEYALVPAIVANAPRLGQVFLNLVLNAVQALPEHNPKQDKILLRTKLNADHEVVAEVIDTGHGISPENLDRVFKPFFTTKPKGVGTGLGLAICQSIVSGLGGRMEVESEVGVGTTFRVIFPASERAIRPPSVLPMSIPPPRARVLVIDDELPVGRALARILGPGHEVTLHTSSTQARDELLAGADYDIIFCDVMMPDLDGVSLHEELQKTRPEIAERMVFVTGGAFSAKARDFLENTKNRCLQKPYDVKEVRAAIRERLQKLAIGP